MQIIYILIFIYIKISNQILIQIIEDLIHNLTFLFFIFHPSGMVAPLNNFLFLSIIHTPGIFCFFLSHTHLGFIGWCETQTHTDVSILFQIKPLNHSGQSTFSGFPSPWYPLFTKLTLYSLPPTGREYTLNELLKFLLLNSCPWIQGGLWFFFFLSEFSQYLFIGVIYLFIFFRCFHLRFSFLFFSSYSLWICYLMIWYTFRS